MLEELKKRKIGAGGALRGSIDFIFRDKPEGEVCRIDEGPINAHDLGGL